MTEINKKNRFVAAFHGLVEVYKSEQNFKIHLIAFIAVVICSFLLRITTIEWMFILACSFLVLTCEVINTALEKLCDQVQPEHDHRIGKIKDISAASVFICAVMSVLIGALVFIPYLVELF